jgi:hypothetical protein
MVNAEAVDQVYDDGHHRSCETPTHSCAIYIYIHPSIH